MLTFSLSLTIEIHTVNGIKIIIIIIQILLSLSDTQWLQASMPIKHGGLEIRRVTSLAASAFLASAASTSVLQEQILAQFPCQTDSSLDSYLSSWSTIAGPPRDPLSGKQSFWDSPGLQADRALIEDSFVEPSQKARFLPL